MPVKPNTQPAPLPMPQEGGRYLRNPDGSLTKLPDEDAPASPTPPEE